MSRRGFAVLFIMADGQEEYVCSGLSKTPARFFSSVAARDQGDFIAMGYDDDDYQSFNVVPYPTDKEIKKWQEG